MSDVHRTEGEPHEGLTRTLPAWELAVQELSHEHEGDALRLACYLLREMAEDATIDRQLGLALDFYTRAGLGSGAKRIADVLRTVVEGE